MRGFWGDIVISPYFTLSLEVDSYPENERLFSRRNEQFMHVAPTHQMAQHVAEFNVYAMIYMLDKLEEYHLHFEDSPDGSLALKKKKRPELIEEKPEEKSEAPREPADKACEGEEAAGEPEAEPKFFINEKKEDSIDDKFFPGLVQGLSGIEVRLCPVSDGLEKLSTKKKFQGLFDVVANGFLQSTALFKDDSVKRLLQPGSGVVYQENAQYPPVTQLLHPGRSQRPPRSERQDRAGRRKNRAGTRPGLRQEVPVQVPAGREEPGGPKVGARQAAGGVLRLSDSRVNVTGRPRLRRGGFGSGALSASPVSFRASRPSF